MSDIQTASSFFVCFVAICLVTCEDVCEISRVEHGDVMKEELIPTRNSSGHQTGTKAIYLQVDAGSSEDNASTLYIRCRSPYRFQGDRMRTVAEVTCTNGRWVPFPICLPPACDKRSLNYRGLDKAGQKKFFHGESFMPTCQHDYKVSEKVDRRIHCENGRWTGNLPPCVEVSEVQCKLPQKPDFGSLELTGNSATVGSVVTFKCDNGRKLVGSAVSTCNSFGEWTSPTPTCVAPCKTESLSNFEGLLVESCRTLDDGEWLLPKCREGFEVANKNDTKIYCRGGKWTGNVPPCSPVKNKPCVVPSVANGELEKYEQVYKRRHRWRTAFKKISTGGTLDENEEMILTCNDGYVPKGQSERNITIICRGGQLSPEPEYVTTRCDKASLNYPGLARSQGFLISGHSFVPTCLSGYKVTEKSDKKIYCNSGSWSGNLPPCTKAQCETEELAGFHGLVLQGYRTLDEGEWFQPRCAEGFEFSNKLDSRVYCRGGTLQGNLPPCSPAHCSNNPPVPDNGKIKSFRAIGHGSSVEYECLEFYEMIGRGDVVCNHGQWSGSPPTCKDTRCYLRNLSEKDGVDLTDDDPIYSHQRAKIVCIRGYNLKYPEVYCENGEWKAQNLLSPCQKDECEVKQIPQGTILKEKSIPKKNFLGILTGTETVREDANIGSVESNGAVLYVKCNGQYRFQGEEESEEQVSITCRKGEWTPLPVCVLPQTCSVGSLYDVIPEGVVPLIEGGIEENVAYGYELRLGCAGEGAVLQGDNTVVCREEGKWKAGDNLQCVKGCASVRGKSDSDLLISPDQEIYNIGESIMFSCRGRKRLTPDVQRILCFGSGWTPNTIPNCQ